LPPEFHGAQHACIESWVHQIKERLFHGEAHEDAGYDASYSKFHLLTDNFASIRASINVYAASLHGVAHASDAASAALTLLQEDTPIDSEYQCLCKQVKAAHVHLNSQQQSLSTQIVERLLTPMEEQIASFRVLHDRIAQRNALQNKLEYYINKVTTLNRCRDERGSKGHPETLDQIRKHDRNCQKLDLARSAYVQHTSELVADLSNVWNARVAILGPAIASFVEVEKLFSNGYVAALSEMTRSASLETAPAGLVSRRLTAADVALGSSTSALAVAPVIERHNMDESGLLFTPRGMEAGTAMNAETAPTSLTDAS
jgi:hypothetical protein